MGQLKSQIKPFDISKREVVEAWEEVRANKGAPGVDGQCIADFEKDLKGNLYKVWNRMSSGSYFPPPVRAVEIPKPHGGGTRMLGIPAVADRVAQDPTARPQDESRGVGLDQLLRPISVVGVGTLRDAHQRLSGALDPPEVQTARGQAQGPGEAAGDRPAIPPRMFAQWRISVGAVVV
ncbi:hypothetical protein RB196_21445 [Streptomyces sp. PmtA]